MGAQVVEEWYRLTDGLLLRRTESTDTQQDTVIEPTRFEERSTIELFSLEPLR